MSEANALPDRFSELIRVAVHDGRGLDRDRYRPLSEHWHEPRTTGDRLEYCRVCTAGAVIAGTLERNPGDSWYPGMFDSDTEAKLVALDKLRRGEFNSCGRALGVPPLHSLGVPRPVFLALEMATGFASWETYARHLDALAALAHHLEAAGY